MNELMAEIGGEMKLKAVDSFRIVLFFGNGRKECCCGSGDEKEEGGEPLDQRQIESPQKKLQVLVVVLVVVVGTWKWERKTKKKGILAI